MNKAFEKILARFILESSSCKVYKLINPTKEDIAEFNIYKKCIEIVKEVEAEYNGGWIPCIERLPEDDKKQYIVQKTNGFIDILGFTKDAYKLDRYDFAEYKGKKKQLFYEYDSEYGYTEWECEAWQQLPEPFKKRY